MAAAAPAADHPIKRARVSDDDSLQAWTQSLTDHPVIIPPDSDVEEMYDAPLSDWETAVLHDPVLICDVAHEGDSFCSPVHPYFTNPSMDDAQIPPDLVNPLGGTYHRGQGGGNPHASSARKSEGERLDALNASFAKDLVLGSCDDYYRDSGGSSPFRKCTLGNNCRHRIGVDNFPTNREYVLALI